MGSLRDKLKKEGRLEALQNKEYSMEINPNGYAQRNEAIANTKKSRSLAVINNASNKQNSMGKNFQNMAKQQNKTFRNQSITDRVQATYENNMRQAEAIRKQQSNTNKNIQINVPKTMTNGQMNPNTGTGMRSTARTSNVNAGKLPVLNETQKNKEVLPKKYEENKEAIDNKKWYQKILKEPEILKDNLRHFEDGYDVGDITKTYLETKADIMKIGAGTVADLGLGVVKGVVGIGEGVGKALAGAGAQVADWTGHDEYAKLIRDRLAGREKGAFDEKYLPTNLVSGAQEKVDKASVAGEYADKVSENVGYTAGLVALNSVAPGSSTPAMFLNSGGNALAEAYAKDENVEDWQAWTKAIGSATFETVIEKSSGLFGGKGIGEKMTGKIAEQISSGAGKSLCKLLGVSTDESLEEFKSYVANYGLDRFIDAVSQVTGSEVKFSEDWNWSEVGEAMAIAFVATLPMSGSNIVSDMKTENSLTRNELIDSSNLGENSKEQLKRLSEKNNWTVENLKNMLEEGGNLNTQNNIQNNENMKQSETINNFVKQIKELKTETNISEQEKNTIKELTEYNMKEYVNSDQIKNEKTANVLNKITNMNGNYTANSQMTNMLIDNIKESGIIKPIYISNETGKVIDGAHRALIANELGIDEIPVKYISSSKEIDKSKNDWYNLIGKELYQNGKKETRTSEINAGNQYERIYNKGSNGIDNNGGNSGQSNKLYQEVQGTVYRPTDGRLSTETVYGRDFALGRGIKNSNESSFYLPPKVEDKLPNLANNSQNNGLLENSQQITQEQNKMPQNGNMEQFEQKDKNKSNTLVNNQEIDYSNIKLGETKNVLTKELMTLYNQGGYRTDEQITNLRENIKQNGITEPIEIYRKNDGTYEIENGNHRLQIANELGIENVPVKLVESWENIGSDNNVNSIKNDIKEEIYVNQTSKGSSNIDERRRSGDGMLPTSDVIFANRGTTERNVGISERTPNSNQQTSNVENERNSGEIENSNESSFYLPPKVEDKLPNLANNSQNKDVLENNQQITQEQNKTPQNGNMEQFEQSNFKTGLEKFKSKQYNQNDNIEVLSELPEQFYNLGYDTKQPLYLNMNKLENIMKEPKGTVNGVNQHGITMDIIEKLPDALNNPLNIVKNPKFRNRFVMITNLTDQYGDMIVVPVEINHENAEVQGVSKINSIYGKETYDLPRNDNEKSYMEYNKDNIVYDIDNQKNSSSNYRLQLPSETTTVVDTSPSNVSTLTNIIPQNENKMQVPTEKNNKNVEQETNMPNLANNSPNSGLLEQSNRITSSNQKTSKNGNMGQFEGNNKNNPNTLVNNQEISYNNNESEVDVNGKTQNIEGNDTTGWTREIEERSTNSREYTWEEYNKWEQNLKSISKEQLTENERQSIEKAKLEYNKDVYLYDENDNNNTYSGGASANIKNRINISRQEAEVTGLNYMIDHENVESDIMHNETANDILDRIIDTIMEDKGFKNQAVEFWKDQKGNKPKDDLIAKDILCDRFAERKSQKSTKYLNVLNDATRNTIDMALDNYYKQVYGKELQYFDYNTEKNSSESSFSLPKLEEKLPTLEEKNIDKYNKYKQNIIKSNEKAINNLISYKNDSVRSIENSILQKQELLNSKQNKDTKIANTIKMQIENLKNRKTEIENMYNEKIDKFNSKIDKKQLEIEAQKQMKKDARETLSLEIKPLLEGSENWKDKSMGIKYNRETAQRNIYDIVPDKESAELINKTIFDPVQKHQANKTREINNLFSIINDLNLDKKKKYIYIENEKGQPIKLPEENAVTYKVDEATLAQLYIEKKITQEDLKTYGVDVEKIKKTADTFTSILDNLYEKMNETVIQYGYSPIGKIENYFPHFTENKPDNIIGKVASLVGVDTTNQELPTEIAGRTENFKPGKVWNSSLLQRKSNKTDYDALQALERYIAGAEDIIHTTEDIQRLRQFGTELRYKYSEKGIQERIDKIKNDDELMPFEQEEQISAILESKNNQLHQLSHFATWLDDYTNVLANKKNSGDREIEKAWGRNMYTTMSSIEGRIAANTIGGNLSVSLTNFAPLAQAMGTTKVSNVLIGMLETTKNNMLSFTGKKDTSFVTNSDFLTNRFETDSIKRKSVVDKFSDVASLPMNAIDSFTAESIVRAKYRENLQQGMNEEEALQKADKYAGNLMADRSKGALPVMFNSKNPVAKLVNMFQVEPNNIVSNYLKDMPREAKSKTDLSWKATKLMVASYAFNSLAMMTRGGNEVLPDPIRFVTYLAKWLFSDDDEEKEQAQSDMLDAIVGATPFASNVAGILGMEDVGRIPISGAFPNLKNIYGAFDEEVSDEYKKEVLMKELSKPLFYLGMPVSGAQLNKTIQGIATMRAGGSYKTNKEGEKELQFPVEQNIPNAVKATVFGKYSLPSANSYVESGFKSFNSEATKLYDETGIDYNVLSDYINYSKDATIKDENEYTQYTDKDNNVYWYDKENQTVYTNDYKKSSENIKNLKKSSKKELLVEYVNNLKISDKDKMALYKYNIVSSTASDDGTSALSDMEHMLKNGMSNKDFMSNYTKAIENNIDFPDAEEYDKIKNAKLKVDTYLNYKIDVKEKTAKKREETGKEDVNLTDSEKIKVLQSSNYSSKEKDALYSNYIMNKSDDKKTEYENLKEDFGSEAIINQYLEYKTKLDDKLKALRATGEKKENESLTNVEKINLLKEAGYNKYQNEALYVNTIANDSSKKIYKYLKELNNGNCIDDYMTYLTSDISADKTDNGLKSGKSVTGSASKKKGEVINKTNLTKLAKIYLYATSNAVTKQRRSDDYYKLAKYVKSLPLKEQKEILSTIHSAKETTTGGYYWE